MSQGPARRFSLLPRNRRQWTISLSLLAVFSGITGCSLYQVIAMPGSPHDGPLPVLGAEERACAANLERHVRHLAETIGERNHLVQERYDAAAAYVTARFEELGYAVERQVYKVEGQEAVNLIVEVPGTKAPEAILVVGAHYDSSADGPGANDNASGTAGLIELARLFKGRSFPITLRLVAFANEEPPHFKRATMGSLVYARACRAKSEAIRGMISLETIGYYSDEAGSQDYPFPFNLFYPDRGDFIGFVGDRSSRAWTRRCIAAFREKAAFPSEGVAAPGTIPGISWSDHWSFWQCGYPGVMVTDTAPFRYPHYHKRTDSPDKLDYERMGRVVVGLGAMIEALAQE